MKKIKNQNFILILCLIFVALFFLGCSKDETRIRVNNVDPISELSNVQIGPVNFGYVKNQELTGYKGITEGTHEVTYKWGNTNMKGDITISDKGDYTLLMTTLTVQLHKD